MKLFLKLQSGISFKNPDPFSPRRDVKSNNHKFHHHNRGFSGPIIIPEEARRKSKFDVDIAKEEPTSPKISCMGQIKQKKKKIIKKTKTKTTPLPEEQEKNPFTREHPGSGFWTSRGTDEKKKRRWGNDFDQNVSGGSDQSRQVGDVGGGGGAPPSLGQLKKFASGRDTLSRYDWKTTQKEDEEEEEEIIIPFSAPILMGRIKPVVELEPKKEINLWKRRTMAQPQPLHVK